MNCPPESSDQEAERLLSSILHGGPLLEDAEPYSPRWILGHFLVDPVILGRALANPAASLARLLRWTGGFANMQLSKSPNDPYTTEADRRAAILSALNIEFPAWRTEPRSLSTTEIPWTPDLVLRHKRIGALPITHLLYRAASEDLAAAGFDNIVALINATTDHSLAYYGAPLLDRQMPTTRYKFLRLISMHAGFLEYQRKFPGRRAIPKIVIR